MIYMAVIGIAFCVFMLTAIAGALFGQMQARAYKNGMNDALRELHNIDMFIDIMHNEDKRLIEISYSKDRTIVDKMDMLI